MKRLKNSIRESGKKNQASKFMLWPSHPKISYLINLLILFCAYFVTGYAGIMMNTVGGLVTLVWLPTGISLFALLTFGLRLWPAVLAGAFFLNLAVGTPLLASIGIAFGNTIEALLAAFLLQSVFNFRPTLERIRDVVALVGVGALFCTFIGATIGSTSLYLSGAIPQSVYLPSWSAWWLGNMLSNLVVAPFLMVWCSSSKWPPMDFRKKIEAGLLTLSLAVIIGIVFFVPLPVERLNHPLAYITFPFFVWAALRFAQHGAVTASFWVSIATVLASILDLGPFSGGTQTENLYHVGFFRAFVAVTVMILGAAVAERRRAEKELRSSEARYRSLVESARVIAWEADLKTGQFTYVSPQAEDILGYPVEAWYGKDFWPKHMYPEDRDWALRYCIESSQKLKNYEFEYRMVCANGRPIWLRDIVSVITKPNGRRALSGYMIDIDAKKRAELARKNAIEELQKTKEVAEAASLAKTQFLANMSHEIRTPMNSILGFSNLISEEGVSKNERFDYIKRIRANGQHLLNIIDDILDLTKVEAGEIHFEHRNFNVVDLISETVKSLSILAEQNHLQITFNVLTPVPNLIASDPTRLKQILTNLLSNSIKFTENGRISVNLAYKVPRDDAKASPYLSIEIEDTGIGIAPEMSQSIFRPFSQGDSSVTRKYGGAGLGLSLSKHLAKALGGDLVLTSSTVGGGSHFTLTLPVEERIESQLIRPAKNQQFSNRQHKPIRSLKGTKVLLVEDSPDNEALMRVYLSKEGMDVDVAHNGLEAIEKASNDRYQIVLMDIQMPVLDGLEATRRLRAKGYSKPIIALTAHALREEVKKSFQAGCDAHLSKPVDRKELVHVINQFAGKVTQEPSDFKAAKGGEG